MGLELAEDSIKGIKGKFYESEVFENNRLYLLVEDDIVATFALCESNAG
jgi:hypothetical protein